MRNISSTTTAIILLLLTVEKSYADEIQQKKLSDSEIILNDNIILEATINSSRILLKVDTDFSDGRILNKSTAETLMLKPSLIGGGVSIGDTDLNADSSKRRFSILGMPEQKARLHWFDRDIVTDADGLISATSLPVENIIFQFREPQTSDKKAYIPLKKPGNWGFSGGYGLLTMDGEELGLGFALERPETIISAGTGALLAKSNGGFFDGDTVRKNMRYGIFRPMRLMRFIKPVYIGSLPITSAYVHLAEPVEELLANDNSQSKDPEEIIVTAKKRRPRPSYSISIGSEDLSKCASLMFKNKARMIVLSCH